MTQISHTPYSAQMDFSDNFTDYPGDSSNPKVIVLKVNPFIPDDVSAVEVVLPEDSPSKYAAEFVTTNFIESEASNYGNRDSNDLQRFKNLPVRNLFSTDDCDTSPVKNVRKEKLFECKQCARSFSTKFSLFQHSRRHLSENVSTTSQQNGDLSNKVEKPGNQSAEERRTDSYVLEPNVVHFGNDADNAEFVNDEAVPVEEEQQEEDEQVPKPKSESPQFVIENIRTVVKQSEGKKQMVAAKTKTKGRRVKHTPSRAVHSTVKDPSKLCEAGLGPSEKSLEPVAAPSKKAGVKRGKIATVEDAKTEVATAKRKKVTQSDLSNDTNAIAKSTSAETSDSYVLEPNVVAKKGPGRPRKKSSKYADFEVCDIVDTNSNKTGSKITEEINSASTVMPADDKSPDNPVNSCYICSKVYARKTALLSHLQMHALTEKPIPQYMLSKVVQIKYSDTFGPDQGMNSDDDFVPAKKVRGRKPFKNILGQQEESEDSSPVENGFRGFDAFDTPEGSLITVRSDLWNAPPKSHEKKNRNVHSCVECSEVFVDRRDLVEHFKSHKRRLRKSNAVEDRIKTEIIDDIEPPPVSKVVRKKRDKTDSKAKILSNYENSTRRKKCFKTYSEKHKMLECQICKLEFRMRRQLLSHVRLAHDIEVYNCVQCPRSFMYEVNLESCADRHTNPRLYQCDLCLQMFAKSALLKVHLKTHEPNFEKYECEICKGTFLLKSKMQKHLAQHFAESDFKSPADSSEQSLLPRKEESPEIEPDTTPLQCRLCRVALVSEGALSRHMVLHSENRKYQCRFCPRRYPTKDDLNSHMLYHPSREPKKCSNCKERYLTGYDLFSHFLREHQEKV